MAQAIAICGAGGKTTLVYKLANEYASKGCKVAITTTTKMWLDDVGAKFTSPKTVGASSASPIVEANRDSEHYLPLTKQQYDKLCTEYDIIIIEADGSKMMPLKIPNITKEPVIPDNVNDIIVVYGLQSIDRKLGVVCQRFDEYKDLIKDRISSDINFNTIVDIDIIKKLYKNFYEYPLKQKYQGKNISLYLSDMTDNDNYKRYKNIALSISASGFSKRFGTNKLLYEINGKKLYKIVLDEIIKTKSLLQKMIKDRYDYDVNVDITLITQYDELLNDTDYQDKILAIKNENPNLGQSESIKIATNKFYDYDAISYINCDTPDIDANELSKMLFYFICSGKDMGAVMVDSMPTNPAIFQKKYFDEILSIVGDKGPKDILTKNLKDCFVYHVDKQMLVDIDTIDDVAKCI